MGVRLAGDNANQLAETPDVSWETPYGMYQLHGGHRLWHAPEAFQRTYVPDNAGLQITATAHGLLLQQPTEAPTGLQTSMEI